MRDVSGISFHGKEGCCAVVELGWRTLSSDGEDTVLGEQMGTVDKKSGTSDLGVKLGSQ